MSIFNGVRCKIGRLEPSLCKNLRNIFVFSVDFYRLIRYSQFLIVPLQRNEIKPNMERNTIIDELQSRGGFIRTSEVKSRGEYEQLRRATEDGTLLRIRNGVYVETSALANSMVDVERIVPGGVLCLYSAFSHYGLSTQVPSAVCVAIESKRKLRLPDYPVIDLYYWKKENFGFGILQKGLSGYMVRITDLERTVCDAVKYRNKIGLDVCGEVIDNYLKKEIRNISLLHEYAGKLRLRTILTKYLETRL